MNLCNLCPRSCNVDRIARFGVCQVPKMPMVARAAPHFGEEPCITGTRGSGTVFFAGCNLRCVFCQNHEISRGKAGAPVSVERLRDIFLELQDQGVHNINLVTGSHYTDSIARALDMAKLTVPVAWNSSGYDSVEALRMLEGKVQIYMPDFKYSDPVLAKTYSAAANYPTVAKAAIQEMYRQTGPYTMDSDGILRQGLLVRHLILPNKPTNTKGVIDTLTELLPKGSFLFSLMSQYTPMPGLEAFPELQRPISAEEYERCRSYFDFSDILYGFTQSPESATDEMIPDFDGTGV